MTRLPQKTRDLILARDNWQCAGCGTRVGGAFAWWSIQHRVARGVGGDNSPVNLVCLCGSATSKGCHRKCEDRDPVMHDRGLWLASYEDPALTPIRRWDGLVALLGDDGTYITEVSAA